MALKKLLGAFFEMEAETAPNGADLSVDQVLANTKAALAGLDIPTDTVEEEPAPEPVQAPVVPMVDLEEGVPFDTIYERAGVPKLIFSAEKLLALLEGMSAMPKEQQLIAVNAMDASDDTWAVADLVVDVERKQVALTGVLQSLDQLSKDADASAAQQIADQNNFMEQATVALREQIAELEKQLQDVAAEVAAEKARIEASRKAAKDSCTRETARISVEMSRLGRIPQFLGRMNKE